MEAYKHYWHWFKRRVKEDKLGAGKALQPRRAFALGRAFGAIGGGIGMIKRTRKNPVVEGIVQNFIDDLASDMNNDDDTDTSSAPPSPSDGKDDKDKSGGGPGDASGGGMGSTLAAWG